jgi:hypothetical protein
MLFVLRNITERFKEMNLNSDKIYWANPDNTHHKLYQSVVNRRFCFTMLLLSLTLSISLYDIGKTFMFIIAATVFCAFGAVLVVATLQVLWFLLELIADTIDYLNGN